ncbi:MAG: alpha-galactosidase [Blautia sp.]|nr:alpha-galactosidase [Blautia sp.]MCM1200103.1 alpha-galactosidase [Bacteroides fragilis]
MAIHYQRENRIFTLYTEHTAYQMKVDDFGFLLHLYYGASISGDMDYLLTYYDRGFSGNPPDAGNDRTYSLDALPQEYPVQGVGDYRSSALMIHNADGSDCCDLRYVSHEIKEGKYGLPGLPAVYASPEEAQTLEILLEDAVSGVQVRLFYGVLAGEDILTRSAVITNRGKDPVVVEKAASSCLDFLTGDYELLSFYGRHAMERNLQRVEIAHGNYTIGSRRGTSSHQYNPAVVIAEKGTTEDAGGCYGMLFVYSGNFLFEVEKDQYDQTRAIMGLHDEQFHYPLAQGGSLTAPETILSYSGEGFTGLSKTYHRCIRKHICRGKYSGKQRPILLNSWEAAYFDFSGDTIVKLAGDAAALGIDMVVMDDGWFGSRADDNSSLGDWRVNEEKLGCTLGELIQKVNEAGVQFGIWIEPEMVSENSLLYREHPEWVMRIPGRRPVRARNQLMLDFSREDVRKFIFGRICAVLDQGNVKYVKWDMNRSIAEAYSAVNEPGRVTYDYVLGVYDFLEKLVQRYPDLLIEGCSGGGGRFDAGMLYYTPQIWCSDNTDAVDRLRIQYGTSFFYPVSTVGAHVSAAPNHQTGRGVSLHTRGIVAMAGIFGYELATEKLTEEEREEIREQIKRYKKYEELIREGSYYRLSNPFEDTCAAWMFAAEDKTAALLNVVLLENHGNMTVTYVRLKGLLADALYEDTESGKRYYGSALMKGGLPMPAEKKEYPAYQIEFRMVE